MGRALITDAATEPVSTSDAKTHLRVDISDDDTYIAGLVVAARKHAERKLKKALITQTWEHTYSNWQHEFDLTPGPVQAITYIKYYDLNGVLQTLDSSVYQLDTTQAVGKVKLAYNETWPTVRDSLYNSVTIRFTTGYGDAATDVPENIIHAIKILVSHWYEIREPVIVNGSVNNVPESFDALLGCERVIEVG